MVMCKRVLWLGAYCNMHFEYGVLQGDRSTKLRTV